VIALAASVVHGILVVDLRLALPALDDGKRDNVLQAPASAVALLRT
jgi:hypothetical protein